MGSPFTMIYVLKNIYLLPLSVLLDFISTYSQWLAHESWAFLIRKPSQGYHGLCEQTWASFHEKTTQQDGFKKKVKLKLPAGWKHQLLYLICSEARTIRPNYGPKEKTSQLAQPMNLKEHTSNIRWSCQRCSNRWFPTVYEVRLRLSRVRVERILAKRWSDGISDWLQLKLGRCGNHKKGTAYCLYQYILSETPKRHCQLTKELKLASTSIWTETLDWNTWANAQRRCVNNKNKGQASQ